ncbi:hypothetical protein ON010_g8186 [Phytophthora cinnamomi]|nr:hypothetical protein ON010_g8186 [Phytophthora cinnamomi]
MSPSLPLVPQISAMNVKRIRRELAVMERRQAISSVLVRSNGGKPRRKAVHEVASIFGVHKRTIARLWKRAKANAELFGVSEAPSLKHRCGRKPRDLAAALERLRNVSPHERTTLRSAATASGVPTTTLFRRLREGKLWSCTSVTRPLLTVDNMQARVTFCLDHVAHMAKARLCPEGRLPLCIPCSDRTVSVIRTVASVNTTGHS